MELRFSPVAKKTSSQQKKETAAHAKLYAEILKAPFAKVPFSKTTKKTLSDFKKLTLPSFSRICVVGLGGSSLGTKAFAHALGISTIDFLDNVDPTYISNYVSGTKLKETLFFIISKSGTTIEVLALTEMLIKKGVTSGRIIGVSESKNNPLVNLLTQHGVKNIFTCERDVPGRFSVLSSVGLLPLIAAGVEVEQALSQLQNQSFSNACQLAQTVFEHYKKGKTILPLFIYSEALNYCADWFIQLLAESIGKTNKVGITPIKAVGVKDQHAQLQLFIDGPADKFFVFIKPTAQNTAGYETLSELFDAEYEGVKGAFSKRKIAFAEIRTESHMLTTICELFYFFEIFVAALGAFFKVNYENQPAVELSKSITRRLLTNRITK